MADAGSPIGRRVFLGLVGAAEPTTEATFLNLDQSQSDLGPFEWVEVAAVLIVLEKVSLDLGSVGLSKVVSDENLALGPSEQEHRIRSLMPSEDRVRGIVRNAFWEDFDRAMETILVDVSGEFSQIMLW